MNNKKRTLIIVILLSIIIILLVSILLILNDAKKNHPVIDHNTIIPYLQDGDILLRLGEGRWSSMFRDFSEKDKRFSHLGIVRKREDQVIVIHSLGNYSNRNKGVEIIPFHSFVQSALAIGVFRVQDLDGAFISDTAMDYIGHPFDWSFNLKEEELIYCTELLYVILKQVEMEDILATRYTDILKKDIIAPEAISTSPNIDEISYYSINDENIKKRWYHNILVFLFKTFAVTN